MPALVVFTGGDELVVREDPEQVVARLGGSGGPMVELVDAESGESTFVNSSGVAWVRRLSEAEATGVGEGAGD